MKILALCDNVEGALAFFDGFANHRDIDLQVMIANNQQASRLVFLLKQSRKLLKLGLYRCFSALRIIKRGKIKFFINETCNSPRVTRWIVEEKFVLGLHDAGVIYRSKIIESFELGILNPHLGVLPEYRGRSTMEWSVLENAKVGISTFFIDTGIDTGQNIVHIEHKPINNFNSLSQAKNYLFSQNIDQFKKAISRLKRNEPPVKKQNPEDGRRYYVMSRLFQDICTAMLPNSR